MGSLYVLALDTAMQGCSVAVLDAVAGTCAFQSEEMGRGQSERLVPMVESVMARAGIAYKDLGLVAVTVGPGAFTGLRIGLSTARAFGTALGIPVAGITTLEVLARQYSQTADSDFAVILETKRNDYYTQIFDKAGRKKGEAESSGFQAILARLPHGASIIGDAVQRFARESGAAFTGLVISGYDLPDPRVLAEMAVERMRAGILTPPEPLYLREADVSSPKTPQRSITGK